ncbi:hypothetical protein ANANG_G00103060 [Anguilla anguilla]|uniref:Circadian-associated transcriptional repressor-like n=1 Tax=Anguilla anguilla TaxID=7936 RepID=A0A9D3MIT1_ANGAN|nr:hypothetical protein ANANG_G00103060 [Anguilla anguilla]
MEPAFIGNNIRPKDKQLRKCPGLTAEQRESALISILVSDDRWRLETCGPRMTASDSDCSIDWLASDDEDSSCGDVASESDCRRKAAGAGWATPKPRARAFGRSPARERPAPRRCEGGGRRPRLRPVLGPALRKAGAADRAACRSGQKRPCCQGAPEPRGKPLEAEADKLLHYKCRELQCYILPLTSILNGLQSGRYRERLSSFQESVAMDRIRRILGVLQNPCMGERYINIILKVEVMLKTWFPNVKPIDQQAGGHEQDAMPSKRQKISPVNMAPSISASVPASHCALPSNSKARQASEAARRAHTPPQTSSGSTRLPSAPPQRSPARGRHGNGPRPGRGPSPRTTLFPPARTLIPKVTRPPTIRPAPCHPRASPLLEKSVPPVWRDC